VAKLSLRRYDVQARVSVFLSLASIVFLIGLAVLVGRHMNLRETMILYNPNGLRAPLIYGFGLAALGLGAAGFGLGMNSAGQRRNDRPLHSWIGFFVGAFGMTFALVGLYLFLKWKEPIPL